MDYDHFLREVCPRLDLRWRKYRRRSARRRVESRFRELGLAGFEEYCELLKRNATETAGLADGMRVTVSRFFRERGQWDLLLDRVLPGVLASGEPDRPFRVWSAGCCGGEEPYTLAILWLEQVSSPSHGRTLDILASDIDPDSLERASFAVYDPGTLREVPAPIRDRWFVREGPGWRLGSQPKNMVRFVRHNLIEDPPPEGMDLVLCRYLAFTYYGGERRHRAAHRIWTALRPQGALMIGRKEGLGPRELELFGRWVGAEGFFRKHG